MSFDSKHYDRDYSNYRVNNVIKKAKEVKEVKEEENRKNDPRFAQGGDFPVCPETGYQFF